MLHSLHSSQRGEESRYQVVVGTDAEQLSEVAEGDGSVGLEAEVWEVMRWRQIAALAGEERKGEETHYRQTRSCMCCAGLCTVCIKEFCYSLVS